MTPVQARQDEQIELIAWRGSLSALAARMRLEAAEVARLRAICRGPRPGFLVADVPLRNSEIVLSALRRRLMPTSPEASSTPDGQLPAHLTGMC